MRNEILTYLQDLNKLQPEELSHVANLVTPPKPKFVTKKIEMIKDLVCHVLEVDRDMLNIKCRNRPIFEARSVILYLIWYNKLASHKDAAGTLYPAITDHTTAIHGRDKVISLMRTYPEFKATVDIIQTQLKVMFQKLESTSTTG